MSEVLEVLGDHQKLADDTLGRFFEVFDPESFDEIDHVAYRAMTPSEYNAKKEALSPHIRKWGEFMINGRPIWSGAFKEPLVYKTLATTWLIRGFELIAPPPDGVVPVPGIQHWEIMPRGSVASGAIRPEVLNWLEEKYPDERFKRTKGDFDETLAYNPHDTDLEVRVHLRGLSNIIDLQRQSPSYKEIS